MGRLATLAREQLYIEKLVAETEADLENAKKKLQNISEVTIPAVMDDLELQDFTTNDGLKIHVDRKAYGNITKANQPMAFGWLRNNGHGGIIKPKLETAPKDNEQLAEVVQLLVDAGYAVRDTSAIHYGTLGKWVRERQAEGAEIPEAIGVTEKVQTKVTVK